MPQRLVNLIFDLQISIDVDVFVYLGKLQLGNTDEERIFLSDDW